MSPALGLYSRKDSPAVEVNAVLNFVDAEAASIAGIERCNKMCRQQYLQRQRGGVRGPVSSCG